MKRNFKIRKNSIVKCKAPTRNVDLPLKYNVIEISENAFKGDEIIENVNIPGNIRVINDSAFEGAKELKSVTFSAAGMAMVKDFGFKKCKKLTTIENMSVIISYGYEAFKDCYELETSEINPYLIEFGIGCFEGCKKISKVTIPLLHTNIPERAFYECESLETVEMCPALEVIGKKAFYGCTALTELTIGDSLQKILPSAFESCYNMETVSIGSGIRKIGPNAFKECRFLKTVKFAHSENKWVKISRGAFAGCFELRNLYIPDGKWRISPLAFKDCRLSEESPLRIHCEHEETAQKISSQLKSLIKKKLVRIISDPNESNGMLGLFTDNASAESSDISAQASNEPVENSENRSDNDNDDLANNDREPTLAEIFSESDD